MNRIRTSLRHFLVGLGIVGLFAGVGVVVAFAIDEVLDPARNLALPCEAVNTPGAVPRAAFDMVHLANVCGFVGTDVEFQSRTAADGTVHDYAFVGTMGFGFRIFDVTVPSAPTIAGGFQDAGWQNDVQVRGDIVVSTFDGVAGEPSTTSTCLAQIPGSSGQGVDIFRLDFDPATATFTTANPTCVANPPGGAHNATLHPSGDWLAIGNSSSDWAVDLVDLRDLGNDNAVHTYRFIDATRETMAGRCPAVGVDFTCVVVTGPGGAPAPGLWRPHDIFFSEDGNTMYVAAIQSTFIVDVSDALNGTIETISIIDNADPADPDPSAQISISHQSDTTVDGEILVVTDENGGGVTATGCNTSGEGKIGAAHFYALAPISGEPATAAASPANPVKLGFYVNPNPVFAPDELQGELDDLGRGERACTIHVFRNGGNGTASPGEIQAGFDGVSTVGVREFVVGWYGAGVWYVDFSGRPSNTDGHVEDPRSTWGNTLGFINMPGAEAWSAKEYKGHVYAGDMARGFDVYGFADCDDPIACTLATPLNNAPEAEDDEAAVENGGSVVVEVLANDSDPDGDPLTIQSFTEPDHGTVTDSLDGTLTYTHDGSGPGDDDFRYTVSDGRGKTDQAKVSIEITDPGQDEGEGRVHGSGRWDRGTLEKYDKVDFSFDAKTYKGGLKGKLKVKDKAIDTKIDAKTITSLSTGAGVDCGGLTLDGANSFAFTATGTFEVEDVETAAEFFACGVDNGKNKQPPVDYFYVACTSGCGYDTGSRVADNSIDGGNIHLHDPITTTGGGTAPTGSASSTSSAEPEVVTLDPLLLDTAPAGSPLVLTAVVESPAGLLAGTSVTLQWVAADGGAGEATALTDGLGVAVFVVTVPAGDVDYTAVAGGIQSNGVRITGLG